MKIQTVWSEKNIHEIQSQGIAVLLAEDFTPEDYSLVSKFVDTDVRIYLEMKKFTGAVDSILVLPIIHGNKTTKLYPGLLKQKQRDNE